MQNPVELSNINNITISGRIASGATTLAHRLSQTLGWKILKGGELFREISNELGISIIHSGKRPDDIDLKYEEKINKIFLHEKHNIIESHLSGFDAQGIPGVFKIICICENNLGVDQTLIRAQRLIDRQKCSIDEAMEEIIEREKNNLEKWRKLYAQNDPNWVYWDQKYYDLVINTYFTNAQETLDIVLKKIGYNP